MKIDSSKKKTLIIVGAVVVLAVVGLLLMFGQKQTEQAKEQTDGLVETAITNWGTYTDQSSDDYLKSIKPYYSNELYAQAVSDAEQLKKMSEKFGPNLSSTFKITTTSVVSSTANEVKYQISGNRQTPDINENYEQTVVVTFKKINEEWKVTDIEEQKQDD